MVRPVRIVAVALVLLLAACGCSAPSDSPIQATGQPRATEPAADSPASEAGVEVGTLVPRGEVTGSSIALVTPEVGGVVTLDLGGGASASLEIPPGAVAEQVLVSLRAFRAGSVRGLRMEPDGLWLTKPAALTITSAPGVMLRIGAQAMGDLYAVAATSPAGQVPVVRLRPAIIDDGSVTPTTVNDEWPDPQRPGASAKPGAVDPPDQRAGEEEAKEAENPDGEVDGTEEVQSLAASWIPTLTSRCADPEDASSARLAATRRTAGPQAPAELPECLTRYVTVLATWEVEARGNEGLLLNQSETISGRGEVSNASEDSLIPLEGEAVGVAEARSWGLSGFGVPLAEETFTKDFGLEPSGEYCTIGSLENGQMSVEVDVAQELTLSLEPVSGQYTVTCLGTSESHPMSVWDGLRDIKGMAPGEPFVFTFPPNRMSSNVFSSSVNAERAQGTLEADGKFQFRAEGYRLTASMVVSLYESSKDQQERQDSKSASPTKSS